MEECMSINHYNPTAGVDVVIPYYNHSAVISRALSSIAMQTIAKDIHVVIVDDASATTDINKLQKIIEGFNATDIASIKVVSAPENMGPGHARAVGQQSCSHEFITFMDADDTWANAYSIEWLVDAFTQHRQLDAVFGGFLEETGNPQAMFVEHKQDCTWMFGKMYRRAFLDTNNILMNDSRSNEDMGFNQLVLACTDNIGFMEQAVYFWMKNDESITRKKNNDYQFTGLLGYIWNHEWAEKERQKRHINTTEKGQIAAVDALIMCYFYYMEVLQDRPKDQAEKCLEAVQSFFNTAYKEGQVPETILAQRFSAMNLAHSQPGGLLTRVIPKMSIYGFVDLLKNRGEQVV